MYLSTLPYNDKSYEEWKKELQQGQPSNSNNVSLTTKELETAKYKAENILSNFNPYK